MASEIPSGCLYNPFNRAIILKQKVTSTLTASLEINNHQTTASTTQLWPNNGGRGIIRPGPAFTSTGDLAEDRLSDRCSGSPRGFLQIKEFLLGGFKNASGPHECSVNQSPSAHTYICPRYSHSSSIGAPTYAHAIATAPPYERLRMVAYAHAIATATP